MRTLTPYVYARRVVGGKSVLDVGCGVGHGARLLGAAGARRVVGVDLVEERARRASSPCGDFQHCDASVMDAQALAIADGHFEMVTCFEVIEHVREPDVLLSELQRVLTRDGTLLLTTPNRSVRLLPLQRPWNADHLREYTLGTLRRILEKHFSSFVVLGICGDSPAYSYYRHLWQQDPLEVYLGRALPIVRRITPAPLRRRLRTWGRGGLPQKRLAEEAAQLSSYHAAPALSGWPFHLRPASDECLNFFVVTGFDAQVVHTAATKIAPSTSAGCAG